MPLENELICDFIAEQCDSFPHIIEGILLRMPAVDLEQCRLVSRTWKNFIDTGDLINRVWETPNGKLWGMKNREISARVVLNMPPTHTVYDLVYDSSSNRAILSSTSVCSNNDEHSYSTVHHDLLSDQNPVIQGLAVYMTPQTVCNNLMPCYFAKASRDVEEENPIQAYNQENCTFLQTYVAFVGNKKVLFNSHRENGITYGIGAAETSTICNIKISPIAQDYPDGLAIFCPRIHKVNGVIQYVFLISWVLKDVHDQDSTHTQFPFFEQLLPGPYDCGQGYGIGLQILDRNGIVSTGLGKLFMFKTHSSQVGDVNLISLNVDIFLNNEQPGNVKLCYFKCQLHDKKWLVISAKGHNRPEVEAIRCYDTEDGTEIWTHIYKPFDTESPTKNISNVFSSGKFVYWAVSSKTKDKTRDICIYCWNSEEQTMLDKLCITPVFKSIGVEPELLMQSWLEIDKNTFIVPVQHIEPRGERTEIFSLLVMANNEVSGMRVMKKIELTVYMGNTNNHQTIKFCINKENFTIYFGNLDTSWRSDCASFKLHSLSLKKYGCGVATSLGLLPPIYAMYDSS